jgi:dTDP-4-amino-4,6-dideoxygalactose transaminase
MKVPFLSLKDITAKYADEIHDAALRVIDGGWYLQGKENETFEQHYAAYIGTKYCIGCALTNPQLRRNNLKEKLHRIERLKEQ